MKPETLLFWALYFYEKECKEGEKMNAEIIAVGTELLMGQIVNTNSAYLAQELAKNSIPTYYQQVVGDNEERMVEAIELAASRSELIILSGGLGPTTDDITKQVLARFLEVPLVEDEKALQKVIEFHVRSHRDMSENNRRQALTFEGGTVFENHNGLAVGCGFEKDGRQFIVLPGQPNELKMMMQKEVLPFLRKKVSKVDLFESRYLRFFGIGESRLVTILEDLIEEQTNPTIAPYAGKFEVMLRLTANGETEEECRDLLDGMELLIQSQVGEFFYGYGDHNTLQEVTVGLLKESGLTIASAESLTGGLFAASVVAFEGSSSYFQGGTVAYQREAKETQLGIDSTLLDQYGMVSAECAKAMAEQARFHYQSDLGISFTGVAGPSEMEGKEVGTIFVALASRTDVEVLELHLARNRNDNREFAVQHGWNLLRKYFLKQVRTK